MMGDFEAMGLLLDTDANSDADGGHLFRVTMLCSRYSDPQTGSLSTDSFRDLVRCVRLKKKKKGWVRGGGRARHVHKASQTWPLWFCDP